MHSFNNLRYFMNWTVPLGLITAIMSPTIAVAANLSPTVDLAELSGEIYDHQSSSIGHSAVYDRARTAVENVVPKGISMDEAKARLQQAGMRCWLRNRFTGEVRCHAVLLESFEDRDQSSIVWDVRLGQIDGRVSSANVTVS